MLNIIASQAFVEGEDLLLAEQERKILSMEYIYEKVWAQPLFDKNAVKMAVSRLRTKLEPYGYTIASYRGQGYAFESI
jgi:DNA-binding response OmpR family regulator